MISELFKSICHDAPKRTIKRQESPNVERLTRYQAQALINYRAEQERLEQERKRKEIDDIALLARLVHESRQRQQQQRRG